MKAIIFIIVFLMSSLTINAQDGILDTTFGNSGIVTTAIGSGVEYAYLIRIQPDNKILLGGFTYTASFSDFAIVRYNTDGELDTTFGVGGKVTTTVSNNFNHAYSLAIQNDGKIILGGRVHNTSGVSDFGLVRYNFDGSLDTTFGISGKVITPIGSSSDDGYSLDIQSDGKIVFCGFSLIGSFSDFALVRYNTDGSLDNTFGTNGIVTTNSSNYDYAYALKIQPDGKIIISGSSFNGSNNDFTMLRYNSNGTLDGSFGVGGIVITPIGSSTDNSQSLSIQSDGKILLAGHFINTSNYDFAVARYDSDGSLDGSFGTGGIATTPIGSGDDFVFSVATQTDGKILLGGRAHNGTYDDFTLVRFNANGTLDGTFGSGGKVITPIGDGTGYGHSIAIQTDGKILLGGSAFNSLTNYDFTLVRYTSSLVSNSDLIAYYPFSDNVLDESGYNNHGTIVGGVAPTADRFGNPNSAMQFNGTDGYILVPNSASLQSPSSELTIASWVYLQGFNADSVFGMVMKTISSVQGEYGLGYYVLSDQGNIFYVQNGVVPSISQVGLPQNAWHFLASSYDGDSIRIYFDGNLIGISELNVTIAPDNNPLSLGLESNGINEYLLGKMDDIRIYNRALSHSEILDLYNENGWQQNFQLSVSVANGWNMVSVPGLHPTDQNVNTWWAFRDISANVFRYNGGYQSVTTAVPGTGYWMKHAGVLTYNTGGEWPAGGINVVPHAPLTAASGWNLFGGYELVVTAANVTTNPPGLQSGPIYKYSGGYQTATTLDPGYGYWIKLTAAGQIIIPETLSKGEVEYFPENWGKIGTDGCNRNKLHLVCSKGRSRLKSV